MSARGVKAAATEEASMTKKRMTIWNREMDLEVVFDRYADEDVSADQEKALESLLSNWAVVDRCLEDVKRYCLDNGGGVVAGEHVDNVFKYVKPESLYVPRRQRKRSVAIMCGFRPDPEHGLAIVFENEKLAKIGQQDIIL